MSEDLEKLLKSDCWDKTHMGPCSDTCIFYYHDKWDDTIDKLLEEE